MKKKIFIISVLTLFVLLISFGEIFSAQGWPDKKGVTSDEKDHKADFNNLNLKGMVSGGNVDTPIDTAAWVRTYNGLGNGEDNAEAIVVDSYGNVYVTGSSWNGTNYDYATIKYYLDGDTAWVRTYNGPGNNNDYATAIAVDGSGNVYVTGYSVGIETYDDYCTIKYNSDGDTAWVRRYDYDYLNDDAIAIAVDDSGYVYVTGTSSEWYYYPWEVRSDYATIKYYPDGDTAWVRRYKPLTGYPDYTDETAVGIGVDSSGNVYVTGSGQGSSGDGDYATIKYYPNGDTAWVRRYNGPGDGDDFANAIAVDDFGNAYVTGGSMDESGTAFDYATIKYKPNGDTAWVRRYNGPGNFFDGPKAIAIDNSGNVYVTGTTWDSAWMGDYATVKYYPNGDTAWTRTYNGPGNAGDEASAIAIDHSGNVYVTGTTWDSAWMGDYATISYDLLGNEIWVRTYNGPGNDNDYANDIAIDGSGNVYVTGRSVGSGTSYDYATIKYPFWPVCGVTFLNQSPVSWTVPPIKIPPTGSRVISFTLKGIYCLGGNYEVTTDVPGASVTLNPFGYISPGQTIPVEITITCSGQAFAEGNVYIKTCKSTVDEKTINLPLYVVCSNDYYECMRADNTQKRKDNGLCSLWVCANTEEMVWDKRLPADSNQVIFSGGVIAAFISGTDTLVGRQDYRDTRTGARDTIKAVRDPVFGFPPEPDCDLQKVYVAKTYVWYPPEIPQLPKWYWITINQQIILFLNRPGHTCPEWKKEQVIKDVWITWGRYPAWWPSPGSYTGHPDIYYGVFADIDAPFDTGCRTGGGESQSGCNEAGYEIDLQLVWQSGFGGLNHPEYANYYVGMALTNTAGAVVTPLGCKDVLNDVYLYPNNGWGWKDTALYQLAATPLNPLTVVDNPDSVVDRSVVMAAGKIPAGGATDTLFTGEFILIEALIPTGLSDLRTHIANTRATLVPELASSGVFSKIFPICGDVNGDGKVNVSDVVYLINSQFVPHSPAPPWPLCRADCNGDGIINISDVVCFINAHFVPGSPAPVCSCVWN